MQHSNTSARALARHNCLNERLRESRVQTCCDLAAVTLPDMLTHRRAPASPSASQLCWFAVNKTPRKTSTPLTSGGVLCKALLSSLSAAGTPLDAPTRACMCWLPAARLGRSSSYRAAAATTAAEARGRPEAAEAKTAPSLAWKARRVSARRSAVKPAAADVPAQGQQ